MNATDDTTRIPDTQLRNLWNAHCDRTGKIVKQYGLYPVTLADALGITAGGVAKIHCMNRNRGKTGNQKAVAVVGSSFLRSQANDIFSTWDVITFPLDTATPALNRVADIVFRNRHAHHQNGVDMPFRVKMEEDDGSTPTLEAEMLGLRPPLYFTSGGLGGVAGTRFPADRRTGWAVTFVYGDRGESGPSPIQMLEPVSGFDDVSWTDIPLGPEGCTARRIYRTLIGAAPFPSATFSPSAIDDQKAAELFFLSEIANNTAQTFTDNFDDSQLDYSTRMPPKRPFVPRSFYQQIHLDRFFWANLVDHPWTLGIVADPDAASAVATVTVSNTGNGTITLTDDGGSQTISNYKTKTLAQLRSEIMTGSPTSGSIQLFMAAGVAMTTTGFIARVAPGVDDSRTYVFREVTSRSVVTSDLMYWFEAIDGDAVAVDGPERFPHRCMFSDIAFPEEINIFNSFDINKDDAYPIHNIFRNDYTFGVVTAQNFWVITGSFQVDPDTFIPDVAVSPSQAGAGSICTRPDSIVESNKGIFFVSYDGLRFFRGQTSDRAFVTDDRVAVEGQRINKILMARLLAEPRTRDALAMHYWPGEGGLRIAFAGVEVA